jgi:diguanylate cyclase (GGDEF)-like protein/PAS domain S-box-containing protein
MSTAARLSATMTCLSLSVLFAAQWLGLIPDTRVEALKARKSLCETLAVHCSLAAQRSDVAAIHSLTKAVKARNAEIVYIAVRTVNGQLLSQIGHSLRTAESDAEGGFARIPIALSKSPWGNVDVEFEPLSQAGIRGILCNPEIRLTAFMASAGFLAYWCYGTFMMRRMGQGRAGPVPERVRAALNSFSEGILVLDDKDQIAFANTAFAALIRESAADLQGRNASDFNWHTSGRRAPAEELPWKRSFAEGLPQRNVLLELANESGKTTVLSVNATPIQDDDGAVLGAFTTLDDQTPIQQKNSLLRRLLKRLKDSHNMIREQNQELQFLATRDPMTKCLNRRAFLEYFETHWNSACRYGHAMSCLLIDVDRFKSINDRFGHSVGDEVLIQVASALQSNSRSSDFVCRYGGEEFCILLTHTDESGARQAAEKLRLAIAALQFAQLSVTASFGVTTYGMGADSPKALLNQADAALYLAKESGRNRVVVWGEANDAPRVDLGKSQEESTPSYGDR